MFVGTVLVSVVAVACLYFLWSRRKFYKCAFKMKGPWGLPFVGIAHKTYKMEDVLYVLPQYAKEYKQKTYFSWFGPMPMVYTLDPCVIEIVLQSPDCLNKSIPYTAIDRLTSRGLLTSKPPLWTKHRKLLNPCFGYKVLSDLLPKFNKFARELCGEMDKHVGSGEANVKDLVDTMGLRPSFVSVMGLDDLEEDTNAKMTKSFEILLETVIIRSIQPWLLDNTIFSWTSSYNTNFEARNYINSYIRDVITNKLSTLEKTNPDTNSEGEKGSVSRMFIDQVIRALQQNQFTLEDIYDEVVVFVIGASGTTASALFSTLMFLAMNQKYQDRVYDEISSVIQEKEFDVTYDDLKSLVYLEMCINETLRLTPPIPMISRVCAKDLRISDDITIPAGTEVYIDIFNIHRDEDIWGPTANEYNPDNFLPSNLQGNRKKAFMPFSKGKRNCIGWQYAGMFLKVILAQVIRKYKFTTTFCYEDMKFKEHIALRYVNTPLLEVERR